MRLVVGRPNLPHLGDFYRYAEKIWESGRLTNNGPLVRELESRIADKLNVAHCVCVANCTLGLQIVARALELTGNVIMPSWTFVATAHALSWIGLNPVFADVKGHHLDPDAVRQIITSKTSAILHVHTWGQPGYVDELFDIASGHGIALICDAAHAFGCSHRNWPIGNFGDAEVFSFHATKFFGTFEGGAITTNDSDLAQRCRRMRTFGFEDSEVVDMGTNAKMSEIHAAMGLCMTDELRVITACNKINYLRYKERLGDMMILHTEGDTQNYQYIVIESECKDEIADELKEIGVLARKYFHPGVHQLPPYNAQEWNLPNTERLAQRTLCLPTGSSVTPDDITEICDIVEGVCR